MTSEKSCGAVVFTRSNDSIRHVIIRSNEGIYGFPKGHIENGEMEQETALREIYEETGLSVHIIDGFRQEISYPVITREGYTVQKQVVYFLAEYSEQVLLPQESEVSEIQLLSFAEALPLFQFEDTRRILERAQAFLAQAYL